MRRVFTLFLAVMALATTAPDAHAQAFPTRQITLVVGFPPGTVSDLMSRFLAERLSRRVGQPAVVENRPGADGGVAATAVARARGDGHTLLYSTSSAHAANVSLYRSLGYDPVEDFVPVAGVFRQPTVVVVRHGHPARAIAELAPLSRGQPGGLTYGYGNTSTRLVGAMLRLRGGVRSEGAPFRGNPQSLVELVAGRLDFAVTDAFTGMEQVRGGALRALAVSSAQRFGGLPDVPSLVELGVLEDEIVAWTAVFSPAGVPAPVVERLGSELRAILAEPDAAEMRARFVSEPFPLEGSALAEHMRADIARWARYVAAAGIERQ